MKRKVINLAVFAAVGLSTSVFGQQEKTEGAVGVNTDTPHATLEVKTFDENGSSVEGVLIPRVTSERAEKMGENVANATLVFITNDTAGAKTTSLIDSKGFYYFDAIDKKWQKVGGSSSAATLNTITGNIREDDNIDLADWDVPGTFALITTTTNGIDLPNPANYKNKIIAVNNQAASTVNYTTNPPKNNSSIYSGKGHLLMSDGKNWYVIGGSY